MNPQIYDTVHFYNKDGTIGKGLVIKIIKKHFLHVMLDSPESYLVNISRDNVINDIITYNSPVTFVHSNVLYDGIVKYIYVVNSYQIELDEPIASNDESYTIEFRVEIEQHRIIKIITLVN